MSKPNTSNAVERADGFLEYLHRRIISDNAAKADLKRALSGEPRHLRNIYPLVIPYLEGIPSWQQDQIWIPIAALSVYYPQSVREKRHNFGYSCFLLASKSESKGAERRFRALLDTALNDIQNPLTALIRQMKTKDIPIDYPILIGDLIQWEHLDQYIQDKWAKTFWGAIS